MASPLHRMIDWVSVLPAAALFGLIAWRFVSAVRGRPVFSKSEIVYQEWFASGCSQRNIITKLGGGSRCVRLVVTRRFLWVTSWFPFSLLAPFYDMEHVIPLRSITSIRRDRFFWATTLLVTFINKKGESCSLRLLPRNLDAFAQSLGLPADQTVTSYRPNKPV